MAAVFNALFTRDSSKSFGYDFLDDGSSRKTGIFAIRKAKKKEAARARNCLKRVKTLRHPSVILYLESLETESTLDIVTESVQPLTCYLESIESVPNKDAILAWGILQIANALLFLSRDAKLHHGRISVTSVYVNKCCEWKLFGFEHLFTTDSAEGDYLSPSSDVYQPRGLSRRAATCFNAYGLGCFIWEVYNGIVPSMESLKNRRSVPVSLANPYKQLVSGKINIEYFIDDGRKPNGYLNNKLINALLFLDEFQLKTPSEQSHFLGNIVQCINMFPKNVQVNKILPQLVHAVEFGCSGSAVVSVLLSIGEHLNENEYAASLVPVILILFSSQDRSTRVKLLQELEHYVQHIKSDVINDKMFPSIVTGFLDTNATVREVTVKSIVHIAPRLNYNNLNIELMRHFARLLSKDEDGSVRTNTVICLGKIASSLHNEVLCAPLFKMIIISQLFYRLYPAYEQRDLLEQRKTSLL
ncbi:unnamed protein product [Soboliphyme baturini]|uniref:N-terminal kinase-like protein n=1 Tax=Soboliphyme baturini TaxID=241478 RepID=A0A183ISX2_9BILA|nr:unnamed protein product [Soboliphyme baturini]